MPKCFYPKHSYIPNSLAVERSSCLQLWRSESQFSRPMVVQYKRQPQNWPNKKSRVHANM